MKPYILAIDQGTTSTRSLLVDAQGELSHISREELKLQYPHAGWVEVDAERIWESAVRVVRETLASAGVPGSAVSAIGISNQRETAVVWHRDSGKPIRPAIVWQSRQTAGLCEALKEAGHEPVFREKTGLLLDPYFSGTKIAWMLDHTEGAREQAERGELLFGTVDTWLLWKLTGGKVHATDPSNASRTLLYNIHYHRWDEELLGILGVPAAMLPEVRATSGEFGLTESEWFGVPIPIASLVGDQQAALFGQGCHNPGDAKNTYGTGCFLLMNTGGEAKPSSHGLLTTVAWSIGGEVEYALEGSIFVGGSAIQWLRDGLGILSSAAESEALAEQVESTDGVYVVPAFVGLGTPHWNSEVRGAMFGITRGTTKAHIARATLESLAYQTKDVLDAMRADAGLPLARLNVDGGAVMNGLLMQFQSDILGVRIERPAVHESTALGAAYLAGLAVGYWDDKGQLRKLRKTDGIFEPRMAEEQRDRLHGGWLRAIRAAMSFKAE
ncbi:glycerol kinase GlpK [Cohnella panacarvi]|uniref:glycerol kinase GlpK n=1 Tax=Cohnella panacarvi TaxID=400776 RepID=UPI00047C02CC|nr:glycerol kinase GlpK [Cohnella panacarvi]